MDTIVCKRCGKVVEITAQQKRKKYCDECRREAYREVQAAYRSDPDVQKRIKETDKRYKANKRKKKPDSVYTCKLCGQKFVHNFRGRPTYCLKCLDANRYVQPFRGYWLRRKQDLDELFKR